MVLHLLKKQHNVQVKEVRVRPKIAEHDIQVKVRRARGFFENGDKVQGSQVDSVAPSFDSIANGDYPVSRPLYFYVKAAHVGKIPGIQEYAMEFTSEKAMGEDGYLPEKGLIPLSDKELAQVQDDVKNLKRLSM